MTAGGCSRTSRAAVFAAVCVLLAALGHTMMSGGHVPGRVLLGAGAVTAVVGWCLAGRERGVPLIVSVVVALQAALHHAFSALSVSADPMDVVPVSMGHPEGHTGHPVHGPASSGMLAAHLLAALLCGLWLGYGERAAFRVLRAVAGWLAAPLRLLLAALPVQPYGPRVRVRRHEVHPPRRLLPTHTITSRGPPTGTAVA